ncbi:3'-5' exonuclease [Streptomyces goshikiensis]
MHRFKGLEFQRVFLAGVSEGQVPHQRIEAYRMASPDRYRQEQQRARSLLFVAATRARDELVVTWNGKASRFLPERADQDAGTPWNSCPATVHRPVRPPREVRTAGVVAGHPTLPIAAHVPGRHPVTSGTATVPSTKPMWG